MIIISGASRGIGKYLLGEYKNKNLSVIGTYNTTKPNENSELYFHLNITSEESIMQFISTIKNKLKDITLINCAGINYNSFAHKANLVKWKEVINTNLVGTFNIIHYLLPIMREQLYGRIINFSSVVALKGVPGTSAYAASKAGLWGLSKSIASENAKKNITINNINLGYFNIGMISEVPEEYLKTIIQEIPQKRLGNPQEIFNLIEFIRNNGYISGSSVDINGGLF